MFAAVQPALTGGGDQVTTLLAKGSLAQLTSELLAEQGECRVLDARQPRFGDDLQPVTTGQPASQHAR